MNQIRKFISGLLYRLARWVAPPSESPNPGIEESPEMAEALTEVRDARRSLVRATNAIRAMRINALSTPGLPPGPANAMTVAASRRFNAIVADDVLDAGNNTLEGSRGR
jgi:hypothetical protein